MSHKRRAIGGGHSGSEKKFKAYTEPILGFDAFSESQFQSRVKQALERVKTILDNTRTPDFPTEVHHEYEDKYLLSEFLANSTIAALLNSLEWIGVSGKPFKQMKEWAKTRNVTLRLKADEECKFLRKETREVTSDTKHVTTSTKKGTKEQYTVKTVTEYFWNFTIKWELLAFSGVDADKGISIQSHAGNIELKTSVDTTPKPQNTIRPAIDLNITWLLKNADDERTPTFTIDRKSKKCRTPRRNPEVTRMLDFMGCFHYWSHEVKSYFTANVFPVQVNHGIDLSSINDNSVFVPVLPLFENPAEDLTSSPSTSAPAPIASSSSTTPSTTTTSSSAVVPASPTKIPPVFFTAFLSEQIRSFEEKNKEIVKIFPTNDKFINLLAARLLVTLAHVVHVCEAYSEGVDYIENMLEKQLVAAIGKVITPNDFAEYLAFHNRKIYREEYRPQSFCYAIRRPDHYPEGMLSIEAQSDNGSIANPISTLVAHDIARRPMHFEINAATKVSFLGDRYVHGYVSHQFANYSSSQLSLVGRARQFSSFILLVGRIVSANLFEPKYATIIQNKDELKIPLMLETIPTPKEFKDAISSLSPEQQKFCKAFRSMQLESTLFGICVIQIKPQLEKVLKLPEDSLTKEIQLTEDLLNLFIKYQIPSDLGSFEGDTNAQVDSKVAKVKEHVAKMQTMIEGNKKSQLKQAEMEQDHRLYSLGMIEYENECDDGGFVEERSFQKKARKRKASFSPKMKVAVASGGVIPNISAVVLPTSNMNQQAPTQQQPQAPKQPQAKETTGNSDAPQDGAVVTDYTKIPEELEQKFDELDENNALRPTIITPGDVWTKKFQPSLLSEPQTTTVYSEAQRTERNKAFDLLDAVTKSGVLTIDYASLHVVVASTHCFDKSIIQTVIQDNVNPIEKVENSSLIVASTIHHTAPADMIEPAHLDRIKTTSALLLGNGSNANDIEAEGNEDGMDL